MIRKQNSLATPMLFLNQTNFYEKLYTKRQLPKLPPEIFSKILNTNG